MLQAEGTSLAGAPVCGPHGGRAWRTVQGRANCRSGASLGPGSGAPARCCADAVTVLPFAEPRVLMDVAESPERDPRSPEDEEEEPQGLSDDDILRESGSDQDLDGAGGRASDVEGEEPAAEGLSQEEESRSDSEAQELSRGPPSPPPAEGEDRSSDLRDEASSVTRELDEHELDYDEEVPEEPAPAAQEDDEERGEGAPGEEGKAGVHAEEPEPPEAAREKKKEDDDGEIDDGEIDVSRAGGGREGPGAQAVAGVVLGGRAWARFRKRGAGRAAGDPHTFLCCCRLDRIQILNFLFS